jgi:uncharacterized protein (TIGR02996 family)
MSEQLASFLHAIREAPDDDGPRLVMADWFEDNGDPKRADFIRTQIRLADDLGPNERRALEAREEELLLPNLEHWLGPLWRTPWEAKCRRGTARVKIQAGRLLQGNKRGIAGMEFPNRLVTDLLTEGTSSRWTEFAEMECLECLTGLVLGGSKMSEADVRTLAASPRLRELRRLGIRSVGNRTRGLTREGMAALVESPHLAKLTGLDFASSPLDHEAMELLTKGSPWKLTSLNLDGTALHDYTMGLLLEAPWLAGLTELSVHGCMIYDEQVQWIVRDLAPARLRSLCLGGCRVADEGAELIAASPHLAELRELWLGFPKFTERGARALADSPHLKKLRLLYLYDMRADSPAAEILRARFGDAARFEWMRRE